MIVAVAVLWNFLIDEKDEMEDEGELVTENQDVFASEAGTQAGFTKRKEIINYFGSSRSSSTMSGSSPMVNE